MATIIPIGPSPESSLCQLSSVIQSDRQSRFCIAVIVPRKLCLSYFLFARVILFSPVCFHISPPPNNTHTYTLYFKSQTAGEWPRNLSLKMGTGSLSALLSALLGPSLISAPSFSFNSGHTHSHAHTLGCATALDAHLYFAAH